MSKVELTRDDGKTAIVGGEMNDKLFARLQAANPHLVSYRNFDDGIIPEMTAKDKELKDYCDSHERVERAMNY